MNAAGSLGFTPDLHSGMDWSEMGAFVTHPVSLERRTPANGHRFIPFAGGFLLHTGYPNPGLTQVLRLYPRQWNHSPIPIIVHLLASSLDGVARMVRQLEAVEGIIGLEIGVNSDVTREEVTGFAQAAYGELLIIMRLPMERVVDLARAAIDAGAAAVSLAPPRGAYPAGEGELVQGRMYGPAVLPMALRTVRELSQVGIPTIGGGGVYTKEHKDAMLKAGAMAVQVDSALWRGAGYRLLP